MVLHILLVTVIPFSLLTWLNICIYSELTNKAAVRRTGENVRKREMSVGRAGLAIVAVYLVCHSPKLLISLCEIFVKNAKVLVLFFQ